MAANETTFLMDPGAPTLVMTRIFSAPRRVVFDAFTRCELLSRWYGPDGHAVVSCGVDLRPGGAYRLVTRDQAGKEIAVRGVFREIVPGQKLVRTWAFESRPDRSALVTTTFAELDGRTKLTATTVFKTLEDRAGYLHTGANEEAAESLDRLAELLAAEPPISPSPNASMGQGSPARPRH